MTHFTKANLQLLIINILSPVGTVSVGVAVVAVVAVVVAVVSQGVAVPVVTIEGVSVSSRGGLGVSGPLAVEVAVVVAVGVAVVAEVVAVVAVVAEVVAVPVDSVVRVSVSLGVGSRGGGGEQAESGNSLKKEIIRFPWVFSLYLISYF